MAKPAAQISQEPDEGRIQSGRSDRLVGRGRRIGNAVYRETGIEGSNPSRSGFPL
jgi:hypothetical protein